VYLRDDGDDDDDEEEEEEEEEDDDDDDLVWVEIRSRNINDHLLFITDCAVGSDTL
jgi:hypothetical protein